LPSSWAFSLSASRSGHRRHIPRLRQNSVAKIGDTEISIEQFRQYYNDKLQQLSQQFRRPISPDQARALGLDRQMLGQLVAETTLDQQAKAMRLGLSDKDIASASPPIRVSAG